MSWGGLLECVSDNVILPNLVRFSPQAIAVIYDRVSDNVILPKLGEMIPRGNGRGVIPPFQTTSSSLTW